MNIGITAPGSSTHSLVQYLMIKNGLGPHDASFIGAGSGAQAVAAVQNKQVDAISHLDPVITKLEQTGDIKVIVDTRTTKGTMDVFVEPILPKPELVICGASPVAVALADLGGRLGFLVTVAAPAEDHSKFGETDVTITDYDLSKLIATERYIVVATQGRGDEAALMAALSAPARHVAFVGSHRKAAALRASLATKGADAERLAAMHSPAGIDIGAVTPEEIALSILTEIVELRRRGQRRSISILSSSKC